MVDEVVVREGLLDHHRPCRIDALEEIDVRERVRRVRVEHEGKVPKRLPRRFGDLDLQARLDLQLHAQVAALELTSDGVEERLDRRLDPDGDTAEDAVPRAAEELRERHVRALREEVPHRHLDGRLGHTMLADPSERPAHVRGVREIRLEELGQDELLERVEDGRRCLAGVPRRLAGDALAPADGALRLDAAEHPRHVRLARPARLIGALERQPKHEQLDPLQPHGDSVPARGWGTSRYAPRPSAERRNSTAA